MSIEFPCPGCRKTLRVPDEAAGKNAKCPQCGALATVPPQSVTIVSGSPTSTPFAASSATPPPPPSVGAGGNPFGTGTPVSSDPNPYAAPSSYAPPIAGAALGQYPIRPTPLNIGEVLTFAWNVLKREMGMCILAVFITMGVNFGFSMIGNVVQAVVAQSRDEATRMVGLGIFGVLQIVGMVVQTWLNLGVAKFNLGIARGQRADIYEVFRGGPYLGPAILASLLIGGGVLLCLAVLLPAFLSEYWLIVGIPVAVLGTLYISFTYSQFMYLIVDRGMGVMDSLNTSAQIMAGNRLLLFVLGLVCGGIMLLGLLAFCVGLFVAIPLVTLVMVVAYLQMTGQLSSSDLR